MMLWGTKYIVNCIVYWDVISIIINIFIYLHSITEGNVGWLVPVHTDTRKYRHTSAPHLSIHTLRKPSQSGSDANVSSQEL